MAISEKLYTADDLYRISSQGDNARLYELARGVLIEMSPNFIEHSKLAMWLVHLLLLFVDPEDLGDVTGPDGGYKLFTDPDTVRAPDVAFIAKARRQKQDGYYLGAPDLAVEIMADSNTVNDTRDKIIEYFQAGTRLVWIVHPKSQTVDVYHRSITDIRILDIDGVLDGGDVLPGFTLTVRELFKKSMD